MIRRLTVMELRALCSDGRVLALAGIALACLVASIWIAAEQASVHEQGRAAAAEHVREQWEEIEGLSAHAAAHFGTFVHKPSGALATLDTGVLPFTGKVVRVEAHVQHPPAHSDASAWSSLVRLGAFDAGKILTLIAPLLLGFTAFSSLARDRESGLLRVLVAQGVSMRSILWSRVLAYWALALVFLIAVVVCHSLLHSGSSGSETTDALPRLGMFTMVHALHLLIVVMLAVWVSARVTDPRSALAILTVAWLVAAVLLPRVVAEASSQAHPLDTQVSFEDAMKADRAQGLDGHDPADERRNALEAELLEQYGVERTSDLPINAGGVFMQADEDYGNKVWDEHFGRREATIESQIGFVQAASFLDPFLAARGLSMGFAGTDQFHDADFQRQAEQYRRELVLALNTLDAEGGTRDENGRWIRDEVDFAAFADFRFETQPVGFVFQHRWLELLALGIWTVLAGALLHLRANRVPVVEGA